MKAPLKKTKKISFKKLKETYEAYKKKSYRHVPGVWCIEGKEAGPVTLISTLTHGCEINGLASLMFFLEHATEIQKELRGKLILSVNNIAATDEVFKSPKKTARAEYHWLDENMNRLQAEALDQIKPNREVKRLQELYPILKEVDFALDLHALPVKGEPMILDIKGDPKKLSGLAEQLSIKRRITQIANVQIGYPFAYFCGGMDNKKTTAIEIETGIIEAQEGYQNAIEFSLQFLRATHNLPPQKRRYKQEIYKAYQGVCFPNCSYRLNTLKKNFEFIKKNSILAHGDHGTLTTDRDSYILFPRSKKHYTDPKHIQTEILFLAEKIPHA